jgi:hypothetical protein
VEDLNTLPLRARLAKQLLHLTRSYGVMSLSDSNEIRIGLHLAQEELAQLLGASRQRVNQEPVHGARGSHSHRARRPGGARPGGAAAHRRRITSSPEPLCGFPPEGDDTFAARRPCSVSLA